MESLNGPAADECRRMVDLLDRELASIEGMRADIERRRNEWFKLLERASDLVPEKKGRAPRGALRAAILDVLNASRDPLTVDDIDRAVGQRLHAYNRESIGMALRTLRNDGVIEHINGQWSAVSQQAQLRA